MDCLQDDEMMDKILAYVKSKPKFFTAPSEVANVKSCLRNSMSWVRKVANFPPKEARRIYNYYNPEGRKLNCLDTSAGFGSRMSGALLSGNNYCGFDPNRTLFKQLVAYRKFLSENVTLLNQAEDVVFIIMAPKFIALNLMDCLMYRLLPLRILILKNIAMTIVNPLKITTIIRLG